MAHGDAREEKWRGNWRMDHTDDDSRVQLKCDGTRWRTGGEVKGKLANVGGSQYPSHHLGTWCIQHYYRWCAHLGCQQSTELTPLADLNGLVRFTKRRNLVSAHVPSHFKCSLLPIMQKVKLHTHINNLHITFNFRLQTSILQHSSLSVSTYTTRCNKTYIIKFQNTWQINKRMDSTVCYNVISAAGIRQ